MNKLLITAIIIAALAGLVVGLVVPSMVNKTSSPVGTIDTRPSSDVGRGTDKGSKAPVVKVSTEAEKIISEYDFDCACGSCQIKLKDCTCSTSKGSVEMKRFIEDKVREGKSKEQVAKLVEKKYGI